MTTIGDSGSGTLLVTSAHSLLVYLHLLGMAVLVGGFSSQLGRGLPQGARRITPGQWHGALLALVSGLLLVGWLELSGVADLNHAKIAVKLVLALAITALAWRGRQRSSWPEGWLSLGLLALLNTAVAVFWP